MRITARSWVDVETNLVIVTADAETGEVLDEERVHNLVPLAPRQAIADQINGIGGGPSLNVTHLGLGTSTTPAAPGDTALGAEVFRDVLTTKASGGSASVVCGYYLASVSANGNSLSEAGLFNASASGLLVARATFTPIAKTTSITVSFTWTLNINAG